MNIIFGSGLLEANVSNYKNGKMNQSLIFLAFFSRKGEASEMRGKETKRERERERERKREREREREQ